MKLTRSAITVSVALLVALTLAASGAATTRVVNVGLAKNGKSVTLHRGYLLVVSLRGNATTGYAWELKSVNRSLLKPLGVSYVPDANPTHLVGRGGVYKLRFRATAPGATMLRLNYARGKQLGGSYRLRVVVSGPIPV
ncbi:MAG: protease inhibitor I42 family protein [Gaiellaceae bacterium]|jgi:predicted secreted protein